MTTSNKYITWLFAALLSVSAWAADEQKEPPKDPRQAAYDALAWQNGPTKGALGDKATIAVPKGIRFLNETEGSKYLELTGNLPSKEAILETETWFAAFSFDDAGYVKDDEVIDADGILKGMKDSDGPANEERRKLGLEELYTDGWHIPPHYDTQTKHLEWAIKLHSANSTAPVINYTVRLLGRSGYESAILVSSPQTLDADVKEFKAVLAGFDFNAGEKYQEFKPGDKVAAYGLAALVAGGAAAVATKTGFWKVLLGGLAAFWKVIAVGAVALFAGIGKLFKKKDE
jgi:uncharacterized membrane-anchored protein